ncbi:uncharacterized protein AB675_8818 [Cyphellophora attinorum]|uniref:C2H2-type domain-containing protein n=1 Tax=Cyphellophora attinorum TaxID=1664694 RepID=A0A0N0NR32_9EURO|nr:uncharacterized protein AB675_8818 [Phialophora attinorum]KPI44618.1 hypothetical protein AB675_8818 [Phialophora attinorum]
MNAAMYKSQSMQFPSSPYFAYNTSPAMSPMQGNFSDLGRVDENSQHYFQNAHSVHEMSGAFDGRRMSQPDLRMRPHTPADQLQIGFPLTPPCTATVNQQPMHFPRPQQATPPIHSPVPVSMQRGRSLQGIAEHEESPRKQQASPRRMIQQSMLPTPAKSQAFDVADMPSPSPQRETSNTDPMGFFGDPTGSPPASVSNLKTRPAPILTSTHNRSNSHSPNRPALSPRRASISDLHLEPGIQASIEETNVTLDDIAQYIEGPDPIDNKWICKFDDCDKRFGRKENIKSHVQTHLAIASSDVITVGSASSVATT